MLQWEFLESVKMPDGKGSMELMRRGKEMIIRIDDHELMGTHVHGSEEALSDLAFDHLDVLHPEGDVAVLIGGLGVGFTAAAALRRCGPAGRVVVAELVEAIARWNEGELGEASGHPMRDERAELVLTDVAELIRNPPQPWHAILLDVDNGPKSFTQLANGWLYSPQGIRSAYEALVPGGMLAVWSAHDDRSFTRRLERADFRVELVPVRARGARGGNRHFIWTAIRPE
ncbi:MAG: hypothetical protein CVU59_00325 [Deltaproteobacteria bacterium HGW-Deltaproteobacteria-17]|nr:MAG: hypothetical protein CVU59_00325 [Deltaproteobacteria bacterium HGW-Deltaproteobacteria-17]